MSNLNETPIDMLPPQVGSDALRFPGKVATGPEGLLAVADSGHNRVVVACVEDDGAEVLAVAETGARGAKDGGFVDAGFTDPQGLLFLDAETLLVADTGNYLIRRLDLSNGTVETVAGTGAQARWGASGGPAKETVLNSPWDLELWDGVVAIAMAGPHQLWLLDLEKDEVGVLAGSGVENLADGPARVAAMSQPSGLSSDGERLWVVDSETSSLRYLDRSGRILTAVGTGLFDFGYRDAPAPTPSSSIPWAWWQPQKVLWSATPITRRSGVTILKITNSIPSLATVLASPRVRHSWTGLAKTSWLQTPTTIISYTSARTVRFDRLRFGG